MNSKSNYLGTQPLLKDIQTVKAVSALVCTIDKQFVLKIIMYNKIHKYMYIVGFQEQTHTHGDHRVLKID